VREALGHLAVGRLASIFVSGNHDVYLTDREREDGVDSSFAALDALADACVASGFRYLPGNPIAIAGVGFVGTCGWYDYTTRSPEVPANYDDYRAKRWAGSQNQDAVFVHWRRNGRTVADEEMAEQFEAELVADIGRLGVDAAGSGPPTVGISHMLPYRELVRYRGDWAYDFMSAYFGSPGLGRQYDKHPSIRAIVAGHTHTPFSVRDGLEREIVVSPVGYANGPEYPDRLAERVAVLVVEDGDLRLEAPAADPPRTDPGS
jgi:hypothetical protein